MAHRARITSTYMSGPYDGKRLSWEVPEDADELILTIGRREGSYILLDYDAQVSRNHARVIYDIEDDVLFLEDVGSRNGTFFGQERIRERMKIEPGDLFRIGRTWLRIDPFDTDHEDDGNLPGDDPSDDDLPF